MLRSPSLNTLVIRYTHGGDIAMVNILLYRPSGLKFILVSFCNSNVSEQIKTGSLSMITYTLTVV